MWDVGCVQRWAETLLAAFNEGEWGIGQHRAALFVLLCYNTAVILCCDAVLLLTISG